MARGARSVVVLALAMAVAACSSARQIESDRLAAELGCDPGELLRGLADPVDPGDASELRERLAGQQQLALLRWGLGDGDERVVFGAVLLMEPYDQLPLPELAAAARVVVPRLGAADCPVTANDAKPLIGSGDFAALVPVVPRLPEEDAAFFLGELHRMVRPDAIPASCELALATQGELRRRAFGNACLAATYSQQNVPLLVATSLRLAGRTPPSEHVADPDRDGLPPLLAAALQAHLDLAEFLLPLAPVARWLMTSRPAPADQPLLRALLASPDWGLRNAAVWALGSMADEPSGRLLSDAAPDDVSAAVWSAAQARRGDAAALERLFAGDGRELTFGLAVASPARRRAFFARLLQLPVEQALPIVRDLGYWPRGEVFESIADPPYDDDLLAELEPMIASTPGIDAEVLRALVGSLPCCETARLADALLAFPADALFGALDEEDVPSGLCAPCLGHGGVWAFLEVTRPDAFRLRLREGLDSQVPAARDRCAELLIRLGDTVRLADLAAWIDGRERDWTFEGWLWLARDRDDAVRELLHDRVAAAAAGTAEAVVIDDEGQLVALAVALGMPFEFARHWRIDEGERARVRAALLAGDAPGAFLATSYDLDSWSSPLLLAWPSPEVHELLCAHRRSSDADVETLFRFDQAAALFAGDRVELERLLQPVRDGRYATHYGFSAWVAARAEGLAMLPFWIDQLGSNCCKCVFVDEVIEELFGHESGAFHRSARREPASVYLRRTLLPVRDRLRWSRIANGYVVAGR